MTHWADSLSSISTDALSQSDEVVTEDGTRLVVETLDKNRIESVHVYLPEKDEDEEDSQEEPDISASKNSMMTVLPKSSLRKTLLIRTTHNLYCFFRWWLLYSSHHFLLPHILL